MSTKRRLSFKCSDPREVGSDHFRCQKCFGCRTLKAWLRSLRIELETHGHNGRVWLCTLTLREEKTDAEAYPLVQRWLKAVRFDYARSKQGTLRYTCVSELGSVNQRLHYHMVVYCNAELTWRMLNKWEHGYSHFRLVSGHHAAQYVQKYLSKGHGKVRSSQKLGVALVEKATEIARPYLEAFPGAYVASVAGTRVPRELRRTFPDACPDEWKTWTRANTEDLAQHEGISDKDWEAWKKSVDRAKPLYRSYNEAMELMVFEENTDDSPNDDD